jgi:hypothetical protein
MLRDNPALKGGDGEDHAPSVGAFAINSIPVFT